LPVIGYINSGPPDTIHARYLNKFREGLKETGFVEKQNVTIDFSWADGHYERLPAMAAELVRRQITVIFASGDNTALAAKAVTATTPIVFTVGDDPVKLGLVAGLNRPGANITGINLMLGEMESKKLGLLREVAPNAALIAVLLNARDLKYDTQLKDVQAAAQAIGQQVLVLGASSDGEIDAAFATMVQRGVGALLVGADIFLTARTEQITGLAARHAIPAIYNDRFVAAAGGLISYGINIAEGYRQAGNYVGRILKGERPAELPVAQATKFELVINLKTAKALGVTIPETLLATADEVIQ
jgi:putative tryptophan/tyrosine transport system substrate-binding protein